MSELRDQFGRTIEYLRISVTDRCNFRCSYCMPLEGLPWLPKSDILSYEEIREVDTQLAPMGLRRIRITGGEPTIRPQLSTLVRFLRAVPAVEDIALSTNGVRLPELAGELEVEDISVAIAVGHPHRDAAYALSRWVIEELKRRVPIWKREHYADGTREWVDPTGRASAQVAP